MATNYFTAENAWRHLFFITGQTADEFYTDGGLKVNIEQLTYLELKRSGYKRIVFYDKDNKLYCYDDDSYALLKINGSSRQQQPTVKADMRQNRGLKRGRHAHGMSDLKEDTAAGNDNSGAGNENSGRFNTSWVPGDLSKILIRNWGQGPLHLGMVNNTFVKRQMDAYMYDSKIKTAVVINDPTSFLREFGDEPMHSITAGYERMDTENQNIMVFLYTDGELGNIYHIDQYSDEDKTANVINIACPNAAELRNMLMYLRINHGLRVKISQLSEIALALKQAMATSEKNLRIKEVYTRLLNYGTEREFTANDCYTLLEVTRPDAAREQLKKLIGMKEIKAALAEYSIVENERENVFEYLTASRLQPNLDKPNQNKEMIHFVVTGNPGTGKTTVANLIGQIFFELGYLENGHVEEVDRSRLVGSHVGETAILTRQCVEAAMGGVLFIDEAYSLKRQSDTGNDFGQEAIDTLVKLMDQYKGQFIVVAAGYPREMETFLNSNPGLASRFRELHMEDYSPDEMCDILRFHAAKRHAVFSQELDAGLSDFCENWVNLAGENWGNAREAVKLLDSMLRAWKNDPQKKTQIQPDGGAYSILEISHIPEVLRDNLRPVAKMRAESLSRLNHMTGLHEVKATVEKFRRRMLSGDMTEPGHYLFTGNPGTGKTTVARYMGQILRNLGMLKRGHVKEYTASELMSEVFNDKNRGNFYEVAKNALDGVLFIDEAYQLQSDTTGRGRPILDALLPFMEDNRKNICVIVAGYDDEMDDFLKVNPGYKSRFTDTIHFENYSGSELCEILLQMLAENGMEADEEYKEKALRALTRYVDIHGKDKDFGNARFVRTVFLPDSLDAQTNRLIKRYGEEFPRELKRKLTGEDIPADFVRFTRTPLEKPDTRSALDDINNLIGFEEVKARLRDLLALKKAATEFGREDLLEDVNLHWVLRGNPGTGKTTIAKLIGKVYKEMGLLPHGRTYKVTRSDLVAGYVGQTAIKTQKCIDHAIGGVLFIDEAYSLKRSDFSGSDFGQEAIDTLLEQMSDRNGEFAVIVAGYPKEMDVFLDSNPGFESRFEDNFLLADYTADELQQIFERKCRAKRFHLDDDTRIAMKQLFENMIAAKMKNWANGREAENLEKRMRSLWAKNPVSHLDESSGERISYYTVDHIPERYRKFLQKADDKTSTNDSPGSTSVIADSVPAFKLERNKLVQPIQNYNYDQVYLEQVKGVVFIRTKTSGGVSSGSGSIITKDGIILTCNHVVSESSEIQVRLHVENKEETDSKWKDADVIWKSEELDAALLKIADGDYHALAMRAQENKPKTGESIYHWGYPFGSRLSDNLNELQPSLFQGYISSIQIKNGLERINTNMEAKRGCSGGPVFSQNDGCIIGILCGSQTVGDEGLVEEINYVLPMKYLWERVIISDKHT